MPEGGGEIEEEIAGAVAALRERLARAERIVALTGAGISTESGIPDFRSPGGIWSRGVKPITYQDFLASEELRLADWRRRFRMNADFAAAAPNAGHRGLAALHAEGRLAGLVTQNIDRLHQRAGIPDADIVEIHGNSSYGRCVECGAAMDLATVEAIIETEGRAPRCPSCGAVVKAAIVSFGERIATDSLARAMAMAQSADLFIVLGSSLLVRPAATLPLVALRAGADLVIVNREATPLDAHAALVINAGIGAVFAALYPQAAH